VVKLWLNVDNQWETLGKSNEQNLLPDFRTTEVRKTQLCPSQKYCHQDSEKNNSAENMKIIANSQKILSTQKPSY